MPGPNGVLDWQDTVPYVGPTALVGTDGSPDYGIYTSNAPTPYYQGAYRGAQTGFGPLIDQSMALRDAVTNTALFPAAWTANTAVSSGQYRSPTIPNGILYRCTTSGTTGATEPVTWTTTIGGTTSDGTAVWTAERGPWYVDTGGVRQFRSILNTQIGAAGSFSIGAIPWDMARGDSLIISLTSLQNYTTGPTNFNETSVMGCRISASAGFNMVATGQTTFNDLRLRISDGTTTRTAAHLDTGGVAQNRPGDGNRRTTTYFVDGITKRMYYCADGVARNQVNNYTGISATDIVPWDADVSAVSGSTFPGNPFVFGGLPAAGGTLAATTFELGASRLDILVLPGRGLPADIISLAQWFHNRGESLIPRGLIP